MTIFAVLISLVGLMTIDYSTDPTAYITHEIERFQQEDSSNVAPDIGSKVSPNCANKPQFPGGEEGLRKFFKSTIDYQNLTKYGNLTTNAYASLVIQKDGRISNFLIHGGDNAELDAELIRVLKLMPKWQAATDKLGNELHFRYMVTIDLNFPGEGEEIIVYAPPPLDDLKEIRQAEHETIFDFVEDEPTFPGGEQAMRQFIQDHIELSEIDTAARVSGTCFIGFVVMKTGEIKDISVRRGLNDVLDAEAIRVIALMPKWHPGKQNGTAVNCSYTLPIGYNF